VIGKKKRRTWRLVERLSQGKAAYIDLSKIIAPLSREFYQAGYGTAGFLGKEAGR